MILPSFGPSGRHLLLLLALLNVLSAKVGIGHGHDHQGRGILVFLASKKIVKTFGSYDKNCFFPNFFQPSFSQNRICDIWWMTELTYHLPRSVFFFYFQYFFAKIYLLWAEKKASPHVYIRVVFQQFFSFDSF